MQPEYRLGVYPFIYTVLVPAGIDVEAGNTSE
jgi:hypothetical protein